MTLVEFCKWVSTPSMLLFVLLSVLLLFYTLDKKHKTNWALVQGVMIFKIIFGIFIIFTLIMTSSWFFGIMWVGIVILWVRNYKSLYYE